MRGVPAGILGHLLEPRQSTLLANLGVTVVSSALETL
jgi:hypothetical protein